MQKLHRYWVDSYISVKFYLIFTEMLEFLKDKKLTWKAFKCKVEVQRFMKFE